jgi:TolB-like protein
MGVDEAGTARAIRAHRKITEPVMARHGGRLVKTMGDGVLLEFPSVVAAVECAMAMQKTIAAHNEPLPEDHRMVWRIGINLGDVLIEGEDIVGDGVNIAARIEALAPPGGICVSEFAYDQVNGKIDVDFADLGERRLKNIARPVRVYALELSPPSGRRPGPTGIEDSSSGTVDPDLDRGGEPVGTAERTESGPPHLSIVVLPFANLGGAPEQDYFVDGVTDSLTTDLSRIAGSFVIAPNTALSFKGKAFDPIRIGRELKVRYVLAGSVQRGAKRLRVNVQLIDAGNGRQLWGERFDKPIADLFDMQDEIVARLARQLDSELIAAEARRAEMTPQPDSMDLYFQGISSITHGFTPALAARARDFFARALVLDPNNFLAHAGIGFVDVSAAGSFMTDDRAARFVDAEKAIHKALFLAPDYAYAHCALGLLYIVTNRGIAGIAECERALALDHNLAVAHAYIGMAKCAIGRGDETEAHVMEALRLSPRDVNTYAWYMFAGNAKLYLGRHDEAILWESRAIEANPNYAMPHIYRAGALAHLGRLAEARASVQGGLAIDPGFTMRRFIGAALSDNPIYLAQREQVIAGFRKAGVPEG